MQPIEFPGSTEIKKPDSMTDEECFSAWAVIHRDEKGAVTVEAPNREDASKLARKKFAAIYDCDYKKLETYVMYNETRQREDLEYYRQSGLPDEIPS